MQIFKKCGVVGAGYYGACELCCFKVKIVYNTGMKKDTHPDMHPVLFRDTGAGVDFVGCSTATSEEKETVDGVEHFVIPVEISSASHPFYTGEENIIDSAGRVEKFQARAGKKASGGKKQREVRSCR